MSAQALLLWDGTCGFCRRAVAWVERRDTRKLFRAVPYQQAPSPPLQPELLAACAHAVHVVTPEGEVRRGGRAVLEVLRRLGHPALATVLGTAPLVWGVDFGYWVVARNRRRLSWLLFRRA